MADNSEPQRENLPKEDSPSLAANISALMGEATLHKKSGDNAKAGSAYLHVLQFDPGHAEAHYNIGHLYIAEENLPKAVKSIQNAIHFKPDYLEAHMTLGALLRAEGKFEEADKYFRSAVQCRPDHAAAHYFLGLGLKDQQKPDEAVMSFLEATRLNPSYAQAHFSLGDALRALGKIDSAIESYRIAVRIQPNDIRSLLHLGAALLEQENDSEAIEKFREVIHLDPANHDAYFGLGAIYHAQKKHSQAEENYRQAITCKTDYIEAWMHLAALMGEGTRYTEAQKAYQEILTHSPENTLAKLALDIFCPVFFNSTREIDEHRAKIEKSLDRYDPASLQIDFMETVNFFPFPSFEMVHHGRDELPWRSKYADLFAQFFRLEHPDLIGDFSTDEGQPDMNKHIHVGIVTTHKHEGPFLLWMKGLVENLSAEKYDVSVVCHKKSYEYLSSKINRKGQLDYFFINHNFREAVKSIQAKKFDLLIFHEVGTGPINYFLPFFRLAPVQCVTMGHGYTTGIPEMDYVVSSDLAEPPNGESHYREQLVRLNVPRIYFRRPELPAILKSRDFFSMSDSDNIYACPQSLFKFHPDFDEHLGHILRRDTKGILILLEGTSKEWNELLMGRFRKTIPDVVDRIRMLPRMPKEDFLNLLAVSDVSL
ncbi:MAG: tetratricopeptide repeat protein, partial [Nitrospinaceae bacterium]|nr:tetratricopeptide repeat protein [Nitrospinaceae bacterium]